ncbi:MAG: hypothetical protein LUD03_01375, partial [Firmicutes bacterium]|nr:hypothetical protein [Bacillota bacterium]
NGNGSNITISGGSVTATAGNASAGIGGGYDADGSNITITGGTVEAIGGYYIYTYEDGETYYYYYGGAGIGGGLGGDGTGITITGGSVTATGYYGAAGIGGGKYGDGGTNNAGESIIITGGTVTAVAEAGESRDYGAGIGGGHGYEYNLGYGNVEISGGNISATTGGEAEPIGHGCFEEVSSPVSINTADVTGYTVTITGGCFVTGDTEANTVYGVTPADDYKVYANADAGSDYPYIVASTTQAFLVDVGSGYDYTDGLLNFTDGGEYTVSMNTYAGFTSTTTDTIKVTADDDVTITLNGVDIAPTSEVAKSPFEIDATGDVTVKLSGANTLDAIATNSCAGLQKTSTSNTLTITCETDDETDSLTATGRNGAGIGGAAYATANNIIINGGTIMASADSSGAGIGSGREASTAVSGITIKGGNVTASNDGNGAGIGGGFKVSAVNIKITGGEVTATGGDGAAGIGGGHNGSGSDITITDGTVTATGGAYNNYIGAGIGGGYNGSGESITISGGYITATPGKSGVDAIGKGYGGSTASVSITGGCFAEDYESGKTTIYGITLEDGYKVFKNTESETGTDYPSKVLYYPHDFTVTTEVDEGYAYVGDVLTISKGGEYTVEMGTEGATTDETIKITAEDNVTVTLDGVSVESSAAPPLEIDCGDTENSVTVLLSGTNTLKSTGDSYAGVQKTSENNTLIIDSANDDDESDTLTATGGNDAAGIGGGYKGNGINITINGGKISAAGGKWGGAGIGGGEICAGSEIPISAGNITGGANTPLRSTE